MGSRALSGVALWLAGLLWIGVTVAEARTVYVDGACPVGGDGTTRSCGPTGPHRTIGAAVEAVAAVLGSRAADEAITIRVRGAHDGFDGVYTEYVKLWGKNALMCSATGPCVLEGCPATDCGTDEIPVISGFVTPTEGWTATGADANTVFTHAVEARGQASEPAGTLPPPELQQPYDAYFGSGSGAFNPVYLLEGPARTPLGYGGSCGGDFVTPCATAAQCPKPVGCDVTAPPDGFWSFACAGSPVSACTIHVNPRGSGDPRTGYPVWIPNRNALLTADGRTSCPGGEAGCPGIAFLTIRRFVLEGARWIGLNIQDYQIRRSESISLERLTIRYAPRFAARLQRVFGLTVDGLVMEDAGRGLAFDTRGTFGLRFFGVRHAHLKNIVARHFGNAGRRDNQSDGAGDGPRACDHCDPPWNDPATTTWSSPCDVVDVKQSFDVRLEDFDVLDVAGGLRIDAARGVTFDRGVVRRTRTGIIVNQLTPSEEEGFVRSYQITLSNLRLDENGDSLRGAINLGSNIDGIERCLTPPQAGEFLRVYNNVITRSGLAGVLVCENAKMCIGGNGGSTDLGTCTSQADCLGGTCAPADGQGRIEIYHNTIVEDRAGFASSGVVVRNTSGPEGGPAVADLRILGNIIANIGGEGVSLAVDTVARGGVQLDRNLYGDAEGDRHCAVRWGLGCQQTLSSLRAATGAELNGLEGDPLFVDVNATPPDLHITLASPARDADIRIPDHDGSAFGKDIDQQTRSGKWDIGADEYRCNQDADCDDGNLCNGAERCFSGSCGGPPAGLRCDDDNPCTTDSCRPATGCHHQAVPDETTCEDADICSSASACRDGICVGVGVIQCPPPDVCHLQGACDPAFGTCVESPLAPDGTACDDGNVCTTGDACRGGACGGRVCYDDPCTQCTATGCEPVIAGSFDAVTCAFRRSLSPPACSGQPVPSLIIEQFGAARAVLDAAGAQTACKGGRHSAYGRAGFRVQKALKKLNRTQGRTARYRVTPGCFSVLRRVLLDARLRTQSSSAGCKATRAGAPG